MTTSSFHRTQGIRGYKLQKTEHTKETEVYHLRSTAKQKDCPSCGSKNTSLVETGHTRDIRGLCIGFKRIIMRLFMRRIVCHECGSSTQEPISFCSGPYVRFTIWAARFVLALRVEMSIQAVAKFTGLNWETVKNIEKAWLKKKYRRILLKDVTYLGIDEVHLGTKMGFITVVRDMDSGAVLFIGKGKDGAALDPFRKRLARRASKIKAVSMDMSSAYRAWVEKVLPDADIVYDHFHVIKLINDRMDTLRKSTMNKLEEEQKKELKGRRFLLLRNQENLSPEAADELKRLRFQYKDLGTVSLLKECLRNIYKLAPTYELARTAFHLWCEKAVASGIRCLKQMAKTIRSRLEGILAYWTHDKLTNASQEGFNNKIGWLIRQAYGYRDEEYLFLKIYDLPNLSTHRKL